MHCRRLLFVLLMLLLPLRAWAGDAMAVSMLAPPPATPAAVAVAQAPCPGHAAEAGDSRHGSPSGSLAAGDEDTIHLHGACDACEVCHGPVMARSAAFEPAPAVRGLPPASPAERFASSVPDRRIKPPIS